MFFSCFHTGNDEAARASEKVCSMNHEYDDVCVCVCVCVFLHVCVCACVRV